MKIKNDVDPRIDPWGGDTFACLLLWDFMKSENEETNRTKNEIKSLLFNIFENFDSNFTNWSVRVTY